MTLTVRNLEDLRVGWQKVVDRGQYCTTIYVFRVGDKLQAVTNKNQGVGELIETISARGQAAKVGVDPLPARGEPLDYSVQYEGINPFKEKP